MSENASEQVDGEVPAITTTEPSARRRLSSLEALLADALAELAAYGCPACSGDCASACPPINACPMRYASDALAMATAPREAASPESGSSQAQEAI